MSEDEYLKDAYVSNENKRKYKSVMNFYIKLTMHKL